MVVVYDADEIFFGPARLQAADPAEEFAGPAMLDAYLVVAALSTP